MAITASAVDRRIKWITLFKCVYLCLLVLSFLNFSSQNVSWLASALAAAGGAFILWGVLKKRVFTMPGIWLLLLFVGIYLISSMIHAKYGILGNIKGLIWLLLQFFLLYTVDFTVNPSYYKKEALLLMRLFCGLIFITSSVALLMAVLHVQQRSGVLIRGVYAGRLYGEYTDPNYGAMFAVIAGIFSIYLGMGYGKMGVRLFLAVNVLVQGAYCVLSGSRTALAALAACVVVALAVWIYRHCVAGHPRRQRLWWVLVAVGFLAAVLGAAVLAHRLYGPSAQQEAAVEGTPHYLGREPHSADFSSGRLKIWESGIEVWKTTPLFGTSPRNLLPYAKAVLPETYIAARNYIAMHNVFLDLLVETGLLGLLSMLAFIGSITVWGIRRWKPAVDRDRAYCMCLILTLMAIGISACFLTEIVFINSVGSFFFWTFLGYGIHFLKMNAGLPQKGR